MRLEDGFFHRETVPAIWPFLLLPPSMVRHKDDGCSEEKDVKICPRDSGYDSLSNRLSILDRLLHTHPIWLQLSLSAEEAAQVLQSQPPGVRLRIQINRLNQVGCWGVLTNSPQLRGITDHGSYCALQCGKILEMMETELINSPSGYFCHHLLICHGGGRGWCSGLKITGQGPER